MDTLEKLIDGIDEFGEDRSVEILREQEQSRKTNLWEILEADWDI